MKVKVYVMSPQNGTEDIIILSPESQNGKVKGITLSIKMSNMVTLPQQKNPTRTI